MKTEIPWSIILLFYAVNAYPLDRFSVTPDFMNQYVQQCVRLPTNDEMRKEINQKLNNKNGNQSNTKLKEVSLDGLKLINIYPNELNVINKLTSHRNATKPFWKDYYVTDQKEINGTIQIQRKCFSEICKSKKTQIPVNLSKYNHNPPCTNALCASQNIFGSNKGIEILWAYLKFDINLSPYSDANADPNGFDEETMQAILTALQTVPEHLHNAAMKDNGFFRFQKGKSLALYKQSAFVANSDGAVFDLIDSYNLTDKTIIFSHELGHRSALLDNKIFDESDEWKTATGWQLNNNKAPFNKRNSGWVSTYAKFSPEEDYAETYNLYRFNPTQLKKISPERYQFMKKNIFKNIEYDQNLCKGQVNQPGSAAPTESQGAATSDLVR